MFFAGGGVGLQLGKCSHANKLQGGIFAEEMHQSIAQVDLLVSYFYNIN